MGVSTEWNGIGVDKEWNGMGVGTELNRMGTIPASFLRSSSGNFCSPFRTLCSSCLSVDRL